MRRGRRHRGGGPGAGRAGGQRRSVARLHADHGAAHPGPGAGQHPGGTPHTCCTDQSCPRIAFLTFRTLHGARRSYRPYARLAHVPRGPQLPAMFQQNTLRYVCSRSGTLRASRTRRPCWWSSCAPGCGPSLQRWLRRSAARRSSPSRASRPWCWVSESSSCSAHWCGLKPAKHTPAGVLL